jgi:hypothetical protein
MIKDESGAATSTDGSEQCGLRCIARALLGVDAAELASRF